MYIIYAYVNPEYQPYSTYSSTREHRYCHSALREVHPVLSCTCNCAQFKHVLLHPESAILLLAS